MRGLAKASNTSCISLLTFKVCSNNFIDPCLGSHGRAIAYLAFKNKSAHFARRTAAFFTVFFPFLYLITFSELFDICCYDGGLLVVKFQFSIVLCRVSLLY